MGKKIGLTCNLKSDWVVGSNEPLDANAEFDKPETVESIIAALEAGGHQVVNIGDVDALIKKIDSLDVDIVFNICEGRQGRNRESEVPILLEMKNIPFVGSDGLTLGLTLEKPLAKKIFIAEGIPTPRFFTAKSGDDLEKLNTIGYPLIVKTCREGSSKGISNNSKVSNIDELKKQVEYICTHYKQPALVEEFISGSEFTVAVLGNEDPEVMPIVQTSINGKLDLGDEIYTNQHIYSSDIEYVCPAPISDDLKNKIEDLCRKAYKALDCRDLSRIDFRVDQRDNPYVLEINPLPSMDKEDVFHIFPKVIGSDFTKTINKILDYALKRYNLKEEVLAGN